MRLCGSLCDPMPTVSWLFSEASTHPFLAKRLAEDGRLESFSADPAGYLCRQSFPAAYAINGAIYVVRRDVLMEQGKLLTERTLGYVMPTERSLDIDTPWDLWLANLVASHRHEFPEAALLTRKPAA